MAAERFWSSDFYSRRNYLAVITRSDRSGYSQLRPKNLVAVLKVTKYKVAGGEGKSGNKGDITNTKRETLLKPVNNASKPMIKCCQEDLYSAATLATY